MSTSSLATYRLRRLLPKGPPVGAQCVLQLPYSPQHAPQVTLFLDVFFRPSVIEGALAYRLSLPRLYDVILGAWSTVLDAVAPEAFRLLLGVDVWRWIGPVSLLEARAQGLSHYIDYGALNRVAEAHDPWGSDFTLPVDVDIANGDVRDQLAKEWLRRLLFDAGFLEFDELVDALSPAYADAVRRERGR